MRTLFVNADDFGISDEVTDSIWSLVQSDVVNAVSIIPNGHAFDRAVAYLKTRSDVRVSVHLNVCEAPPISPLEKVDLIIDEFHELNMTPDRLMRLTYLGSKSRSRALVRQIENEFREQIVYYSDHFPDAKIVLDSHLHIHLLPRLRESFGGIIDDFKISAVRRINEPSYRRCCSTSDATGLLKRWLLNHLSSAAAEWRAASTADYTFGILDTMRLRPEVVAQLASEIKAQDSQSVVELICHPGQSSDEEQHWINRSDFDRIYKSQNRKLEAQAITDLYYKLRDTTN